MMMSKTVALCVVLLLGVGAHALGGESKAQAVQGLATVGQGVAQIGQAAAQGLQKKGEKFVDTAGNVYSVLTDATGALTNLVMDKTGMIIDITQQTGKFLLDSALEYPEEIRKSAGETLQGVRETISESRQTISDLGRAAWQARPDLPPVKEILHPKAWGQALSNTGKGLSDFTETVYDQFDTYYEGISAKYCEEGGYTPPEHKPALLKMPGFFIKVGLGDCAVGKHEHKGPFELNCTKPFLSYGHTEGELTAKHISAPEFTSKECKITKEHGEEDELVLFTFDGKNNIDIKSIASNVQEQLANAFTSFSNMGSSLQQQVGDFLGSLPNPKDFEAKGLDGLLDTMHKMDEA
jgi:hypothetical protein